VNQGQFSLFRRGQIKWVLWLKCLSSLVSLHHRISSPDTNNVIRRGPYGPGIPESEKLVPVFQAISGAESEVLPSCFSLWAVNLTQCFISEQIDAADSGGFNNPVVS